MRHGIIHSLCIFVRATVCLCAAEVGWFNTKYAPFCTVLGKPSDKLFLCKARGLLRSPKACFHPQRYLSLWWPLNCSTPLFQCFQMRLSPSDTFLANRASQMNAPFPWRVFPPQSSTKWHFCVYVCSGEMCFLWAFPCPNRSFPAPFSWSWNSPLFSPSAVYLKKKLLNKALGWGQVRYCMIMHSCPWEIFLKPMGRCLSWGISTRLELPQEELVLRSDLLVTPRLELCFTILHVAWMIFLSFSSFFFCRPFTLVHCAHSPFSAWGTLWWSGLLINALGWGGGWDSWRIVTFQYYAEGWTSWTSHSFQLDTSVRLGSVGLVTCLLPMLCSLGEPVSTFRKRTSKSFSGLNSFTDRKLILVASLLFDCYMQGIFDVCVWGGALKTVISHQLNGPIHHLLFLNVCVGTIAVCGQYVSF